MFLFKLSCLISIFALAVALPASRYSSLVLGVIQSLQNGLSNNPTQELTPALTAALSSPNLPIGDFTQSPFPPTTGFDLSNPSENVHTTITADPVTHLPKITIRAPMNLQPSHHSRSIAQKDKSKSVDINVPSQVVPDKSSVNDIPSTVTNVKPSNAAPVLPSQPELPIQIKPTSTEKNVHSPIQNSVSNAIPASPIYTQASNNNKQIAPELPVQKKPTSMDKNVHFQDTVHGSYQMSLPLPSTDHHAVNQIHIDPIHLVHAIAQHLMHTNTQPLHPGNAPPTIVIHPPVESNVHHEPIGSGQKHDDNDSADHLLNVPSIDHHAVPQSNTDQGHVVTDKKEDVKQQPTVSEKSTQDGM